MLPKDSAGKPSWRKYQTTLASEQELDKWLKNSGSGIGIVCGAVSGGLEVIDFDNHDVYKEYLGLVAQDAYIKSIADQVTHVSTPGGAHWYYRCEDGIEGNQKLAECAKEEKADKQTLIETRGEGGYVIAADNPASVHPSGSLYEFVQGDYDSIPTITGDERGLLLDLARSLNRKIVIDTHGQDLQKNEDPDAPGNAYNEKGDWSTLLTDHGWTKLFESGGTQHWQRPGKVGNKGASATVNHAGSDRLYVFSSNAEPFESGRGYSKFPVMRFLRITGTLTKPRVS